MTRWHDAERAVSAALGVGIVLAADMDTAARRSGVLVRGPFRPPHPHLSLTHADGVVVAAAVASADRDRVVGLGVDYEPASRVVSARAARLFLGAREQETVEHHPATARSEARLVLWTIKEAAYKATPDNAGHTVAAYRVDAGTTFFRDTLALGHVAIRFAGGHLAVAILPASEEPARVSV